MSSADRPFLGSDSEQTREREQTIRDLWRNRSNGQLSLCVRIVLMCSSIQQKFLESHHSAQAQLPTPFRKSPDQEKEMGSSYHSWKERTRLHEEVSRCQESKRKNWLTISPANPTKCRAGEITSPRDYSAAPEQNERWEIVLIFPLLTKDSFIRPSVTLFANNIKSQ